MKKVFQGIGILIAIFTIFYFILIEDRLAYQKDQTFYSFELDKSISGKQLEEIAKKEKITIRLIHYKNQSFGHVELNIEYINPDENIIMGEQKSIFPENKIIYQEVTQGDDKKIQLFSVMTENEDCIQDIRQLLQEEGYEVAIAKSEAISYGFTTLFSAANLEFFILITLLLILCIANYYIKHLKEIGVLKLMGWKSSRISVHLLSRSVINLYCSYLFLYVLFGIYVIYSNKNELFRYLHTFFGFSIFLLIVFGVACLVGALFIHVVDHVNAIKNNKNNEILFGILIFAKIIITMLFMTSLNTTVNEVRQLFDTVNEIKLLQENSFYKVHTSVVPDEATQSIINNFLETQEDSQVYNYAPPNETYDKDAIKKKNKSEEIEDTSLTLISANMLDVLKVLDENGEKIQTANLNSDEIRLLVPVHYKNQIQELLEHYGFDKQTSIMYIQDCQIQSDITNPGYYTFDNIYYIQDLEKTLYINNGDVLLGKSCSEQLDNILSFNSIDRNSVRIDSLSSEYNVVLARVQLSLYENTFYVIVNILSMLLCIISIVLIFLELRKKEFGVYKLIGSYPIKELLLFFTMNFLITCIGAIVVNPRFISLLIFECIIYSVIVYKYVKYKAILVLKGE